MIVVHLRRALTVLVAGALGVAVASAPARATDDPAGIAGGSTAVKGEFPWLVRLSVGCGGALFTPTLVLTAAHCFGEIPDGEPPPDPRLADSAGAQAVTTNVTVTQGVVDLEDPGRTTRIGDLALIAPGFTNAEAGADWALLRLTEPIYGVPLLRIASGDAYQSGAFTAMGWGQTEFDGPQQRYLRKAAINFIDDAQCDAQPGYGSLIHPEMLCGGDLADGKPDTCKGDSGGPLVKRVGEDWVQVGISSWGLGCGEAHHPAVFTEVGTFAGDICAAANTVGGCPAITVGLVPDYTRPIGAYFSVDLYATGGAQPYTWSVSGLPAGLYHDPATGHICGYLNQAGSFQVLYGVADGMNPAVTNAFLLHVTKPLPDVRGKKLVDATSALQAAGFVLGTWSNVTVWDSYESGRVQSQFPSAGTQLLPGASVNVSVGKWGGANR